MKRRRRRDFIALRLVVPALLVVSILGTFSGSNEPAIGVIRGTALESLAVKLHTGNSIIFNLSAGVLGGIVVWFLVAWVPERRKRTIVKSNLAARYSHFKEDTIAVFLRASAGSYDSQLPRRLCDHQQFREYFGSNGREKWNAFLNGFEDSRNYQNDLLVELELLASEISYVLSNVSIEDDDVYSFFKRLSEIIYRLRSPVDLTGDNLKPLSRFLWEVFTLWNISDGQQQSDIIQDMIDRI